MPESRTRRQMWLHFAALGTLLAAILFPAKFTYPAALLFGASNLWLWLNIVEAGRVYRRMNALLGKQASASDKTDHNQFKSSVLATN